MRARPTLVLAGLLVALPLAAAGQQKRPNVSGDYEVKFESVANNCTDVRVTLTRGTVAVRETTRDLQVTIPMMPVLWARAMGRDGKFRVLAKRGGTAIRGVDGQFQAAGRVDGEIIQFVFIAEYFQGKKPLCTQSWNVSGVRADKLR